MRIGKLSILLLSVLLNLYGKTLVVDDDYIPFLDNSCKDGNKSGCFSPSHPSTQCNFAKISDALPFLSDGDRISICPGEYEESGLKIDKNDITIESTSHTAADVTVSDDNDEDIFILEGYRENILFDSFTVEEGSSDNTAIALGAGKNIEFRNLSIKSEGYGIDQNAVTSSSPNIENLNIHDSNISGGKTALRLVAPSNLKLSNVHIRSVNEYAVYLKQPSGDVNISADSSSRNTFRSHSSCIYLGDTSHDYYISYSDFTIEGVNSAAVTFDKANKLEIYDISVNADGKGVGVWSSGTITGDFDLRKSTIAASKNEAVYIKEIKGGSYIYDNIIDGAGYAAIYLPDVSNSGEIKRNIIAGADYYGLILLDKKRWRGFRIDHNCFMQNGIANAFSRDKDAHFDDGSEGNYWDDWCENGSYEIANIPKYDEHPLKECSLRRCRLANGLKLSTYDISSYSDHYPENHDEFDELEENYAVYSKRFGSAIISKIDTTGRNNNPFHDGSDEKYLSIFEGYIEIPSDGTYSFAVNGDDAVELLIDDEWYGWYNGHGSDSTDHNRDFNLSEGVHRIKFRHQEWSGGDSYQLYWKKPGESDYSIVPADALFHCAIASPLVEYRMDECEWKGSSGEVRDNSGNGYDATAKNGAQTARPEDSLCRTGSFDATDDYIDSASTLSFSDNELSISAWIYPHSRGDGKTVMIQSDKSDWSDGFGLAFDSDGKLYFYVGDWSSQKIGTDVELDRWTHIAASYNGSVLKIYKNGRLAACPTRVSANPNSGGTLYIGDSIKGGIGGGADVWNGYIDEVKIFDRALDSDTIENIYEFEKSGRNYEGSERYCMHCAVTPSCSSPINGLNLSTYDISTYSSRYPYSHLDYDILESSYATEDYRFGSGYLDNIDTNGQDNNPYHSGEDEKYLSIFEGYIYTEDGEYSFAVNGDDAIELIIDGDFLGWYGGHGASGGTTHNRIYPMQKGYHNFKYRHQEWRGGDSYQLYWKKPGESDYSIVPSEAFFRCPSGGVVSDATFNAVSSPGEDSLCNAVEDWENNLTTQIVKKSTEIYILSRERNSSTAVEANISEVIVNYYSDGDNDSCDGTAYRRETICEDGCGETDANGCLKIDFSSDYSSKCSDFTIRGRRMGTATHETENNSSDVFAIRPERFAISTPTSAIYAGESFEVDFEALDSGSGRASDYNETLDGSFAVELNESKNGCANGNYNMENFSFADGAAEDIDISYSEIGDINISISEKSGSEFAKVDSDDTAYESRVIEGASRIVSIYPYEINVTSLSLPSSNGRRWLYMANDINRIYLNPKVKVEVYNASSDKMEDFNSSCYGRDINLTFHYDTDRNEDLNLTLEGNLTSMERSISDINKTLRIPVSLFEGGEAEAAYRFGIDRNSSEVRNPLLVSLEDAYISTAGIAKYLHSAVENSALSAENNATFFYGRISFRDLRVNDSPVEHRYTFEVYCDDPSDSHIKGFVRSSLNWYINALHDDSGLGDIYIGDSDAYRGIVLDGERLDVNITSTTNDGDGTARMSIEIAPGVHGVVHLDINDSVWLWYTPAEYAKEYDFSLGSDCSSHPCFNIEREDIDDEGMKIESGTFNGMDISPAQRGAYKREGIKVFR